MTPSTASPSLVSRAPALSGIVVQLESIAGEPPASASPPTDQPTTRRELDQNLKIAEMQRNRADARIAEAPPVQPRRAGPRKTDKSTAKTRSMSLQGVCRCSNWA